jgi:hypothetical protein
MTLLLSGTDGLSDVDGSAATPAIRGTDANTGIFFPAADTIAFSEGGVEAMRLDSSGNLGLGVTPSAFASAQKAVQVLNGSFYSDASSSGLQYNSFFNGTSELYIANGNATSYYQASGQHIWRTAPSGTAGNAITFTQAMTLNASGNLGIGTTSPGARLDVNSTASTLRIRSTSSTSTDEPKLTFFHDGNDLFTVQGGVDLKFLSNGGTTERMRITNAGRLLVNTTSAPSGVSMTQIAYAPDSQVGLALFPTNTNYNNASVIFLNNAASTVGFIYQNGSSTTYSTTSDYRLKENVAPMTGALDKVAQLKPVTYTWKATGETSQGFIAHELQEVVPDCVTGEKDAIDAEGKPQYQGIDTSFLVATLTAAIQEQQAIITQLQADVAELKGAA